MLSLSCLSHDGTAGDSTAVDVVSSTCSSMPARLERLMPASILDRAHENGSRIIPPKWNGYSRMAR